MVQEAFSLRSFRSKGFVLQWGCVKTDPGALQVIADSVVHAADSYISSAGRGDRVPSSRRGKDCAGDEERVGRALQAWERLTGGKVNSLQEAEEAEQSPDSQKVQGSTGIFLGLAAPVVSPVVSPITAPEATTEVVVSTATAAGSGPLATVIFPNFRGCMELQGAP
jgi:hypothetical protein